MFEVRDSYLKYIYNFMLYDFLFVHTAIFENYKISVPTSYKIGVKLGK